MGYASTAVATYTARQSTAARGTVMSEVVPEVDVDWREVLRAVAEQRDRVAYAKLFRHFAPRLRAFGMRQLGQEQLALEMGYKVMQVDVRETQDHAITLFEKQGYARWGVNPSYALIDGQTIRGFYYTKTLVAVV